MPRTLWALTNVDKINWKFIRRFDNYLFDQIRQNDSSLRVILSFNADNSKRKSFPLNNFYFDEAEQNKAKMCSSTKKNFSQNTLVPYKHQNYFQSEHLIISTYMCSSTYMAFSQNTSHPVGRSPLWLFARTFLNFCHFEGVRMALGQT